MLVVIEGLVAHLQSQFLWGGLASADAPPVHAKAPCQSHQRLFPPPAGGVRVEQSGFPFLGQPIFGLKADQSPRQLGQHPS